MYSITIWKVQALGLSTSAGYGKHYVRTQTKTLICTRLHRSPSRNTAKDKYKSSSKTQRDANLMCSSLAGSFSCLVNKRKLLYLIIIISAIYFGQHFALSPVSQKDESFLKAWHWLFHKQNRGLRKNSSISKNYQSHISEVQISP